MLLKREGWEVNHKKVYRLYRQEGLNLQYPSKRRRISQSWLPNLTSATKMNEYWAMDIVWFMSLDNAKKKIETWKNDYNNYRPHGGLTHLTPAEFVTAAGAGSTKKPRFLTLKVDRLLGDTQYHI
jgi:transposase InsO family protein